MHQTRFFIMFGYISSSFFTLSNFTIPIFYIVIYFYDSTIVVQVVLHKPPQLNWIMHIYCLNKTQNDNTYYH